LRAITNRDEHPYTRCNHVRLPLGDGAARNE
jgi:hypothetical protein